MQQVAVLGIARLDRLQFVRRAERLAGRDLRKFRRRDVEALRDPLDRPDEFFRQHHPADAPAGHAIVFREGVDDRDVVAERQRRHVRRRHSAADDRSRPRSPRCRARRAVASSSLRSAAGITAPVGLAGLAKSTPFSGFCACAVAQDARPMRKRLALQLDLDDVQPERRHDVAIGRISGRGDGDRGRRDRTSPEMPG